MNIIMKYPKIDGNILCDGLLHDVKPIQLRKFYINDSLFFLLDYWDDKYKCDSYTILRKEGSSFLKVPLKNYNDLDKKINIGEINLEKVDLSIFEGVKVIFTDQPIDSINDLNIKKNYIDDKNRLERVKLATKLFRDALYWNQGNYDIPEVLQNELLGLNELDLNSLPLNIFNIFIDELSSKLNSCIDLENDKVLLGPSKVDVISGAKIINSIIDKYFKKENVLSQSQGTMVASALDFKLPPGPSDNTIQPNYLPESFNYIYRNISPNVRLDGLKEKLNFKYYVALDSDFLNIDKKVVCYSFIDDNYKNIENQLTFYSDYNGYYGILLDYLKKVKNGECILNTPLRVTLDIDNKCYYMGVNDKVENAIFLDYNFGICNTKEKFIELSSFLQPIDIEVPEDCSYRDISRESFIAKVFKYGIEGKYTLNTYSKSFEGNLNNPKKK